MVSNGAGTVSDSGQGLLWVVGGDRGKRGQEWPYVFSLSNEINVPTF